MGTNMDAMNVRVANAIADVQDGTNSAITAATQNGQKRSSTQRDQDIFFARLWVWSIFRAVNKRAFFGETELSFTGSGTGYATVIDEDANIALSSVDQVTLVETDLLNKSYPLLSGEDLEIYPQLMQTTKRNEIVAGWLGDNSGAHMTSKIVIFIGADLEQDSSLYTFYLRYYAEPKVHAIAAGDASKDLVEPTSWYEAIERRAEYLGWKMSNNTERAQLARSQANEAIAFMISMQYGQEAAERVKQFIAQG